MSISLFEQLTANIPDEMKRLSIPGLALGLLYHGQAFTAGFGVTNVENPLPVTGKTLFQIGSITKTFTALAAMRLVAAGQLDLDVPARRYLPELRLADQDVAARVSVRQLFNHTGGWAGDYFDDTGPGDEALQRILERLERLPQLTPLGEIWSYNNAGFYIAGRVIEVISGKPYEAALQELVLDPLGMAPAFFFAHEAITYRVAAGHSAIFPGQPGPVEVLRPWWLARCANAVGGLATGVDEMLKYAAFQLSDGCLPGGKRLLPTAALQELHNPTVQAANGEQMGVSWFVRTVGGEKVLRHGGATKGQMATLQIVPGRQFAIVVLTNSERGSELYTRLVKQALKLFLELSDPEPTPRPFTAEELAEYAGEYDSLGSRLELKPEGDCLWLIDHPKGGFPTPDAPPSSTPPPVRIQALRSDAVIVTDEPGMGDQGEFLRDAAGQVAWLRIGGRVHRRL